MGNEIVNGKNQNQDKNSKHQQARGIPKLSVCSLYNTRDSVVDVRK